MKINRVLFSLSLFFLALPMMAQQLDAIKIMDLTADAFRKAGGIKATFTVRSSQGSSKGVISMKGEKFLLQAEGITTWFNGHTQWSYVESNGEVNISEPTAEELQGINPYTLLYMYKNGYKLKLDKADSAQDKTIYKIVMSATDRKQDLRCVILSVSKDTLRPLRISMAQKNGETVVIQINSYQTNQTYPDSMFSFDKKAYPNVEVIDLR